MSLKAVFFDAAGLKARVLDGSWTRDDASRIEGAIKTAFLRSNISVGEIVRVDAHGQIGFKKGHERFPDFAKALADRLAVMDRGQVVLSGRPDELDDADVRRYLTV